MDNYRVWHLSWLYKALDEYKKHHNTVNGSMTIEEFINENCKNDVDEIIVVPD
jgi:hypothetical protein